MNVSKNFCTFCVALVFACGFLSPAKAAVLYVDADAVGANTGLSWADAYTDLQSALTTARANPAEYPEIWVAAGTYKPAASDRAISFNAISGVALYGGFAGGEATLDERDPEVNPTILSGDLGGNDGTSGQLNDNSNNVVESLDQTGALFDGFLITAGNARSNPSRGGGVRVIGGDLTLQDCAIVGNQADDNDINAIEMGGGVFAQTATINLTDCVIEANTLQRQGSGGGIGAIESTLNLTRCEVNGNTSSYGFWIFFGAGHGGGMYLEDCVTTIVDSSFTENQAGTNADDFFPSGNGGAICAIGGTTTVVNSQFESNSTDDGNEDAIGGYGGAVFLYGGAHSFSKCVFKSNFASEGGTGGAIAVDDETECNLINTLVAQNSAPQGAGIAMSSPVNMVFCTVADNVGAEGILNLGVEPFIVLNSIIWNNTYTGPISATYSCIQDWAIADTNIASDPLFVGAGDYHLTIPSPCVDAAIAVDGIAEDLDGDTRFAALLPDMGVDEIVFPAFVVETVDASAHEPSQNNARFRISRYGDLSGEVDVYGVWGGTAVKGVDYSTYAFPIHFNAGQNVVGIPVFVIDDEELEGDETVTLTLTPTAEYRVLPGADTPVVIGDNEDEPLLSCESIDPTATEPGRDYRDLGTIRVTRAGDTSAPLTFYYGWAGSATKTVDYGAFMSPVTIPAGFAYADIAISPLDDLLIEGNELARLILIPWSTYSLDANRSAFVLIEDNDNKNPLTVTALQNGYEPGIRDGVFRITRSGSTAAPMSVFMTFEGTATSGVDYTSLSQEVVIPAGSFSTDVRVKCLNDEENEGDETVILKLQVGAGYSGTGQAQLLIEDDDTGKPVVEVEVVDGAADESGSNTGLLRISRTGDTTASLTVNFAWTGNATKGVDYVAPSAPVVIPAGASSVDIAVNPKADAAAEGEESVILTVKASLNYKVGLNGSGSVSIAADVVPE